MGSFSKRLYIFLALSPSQSTVAWVKKIFWPKYELDGNLPRYGLERMVKFFEVWGKSEKDIPPIFHITGTNGKGSTTAFLKYILEANGYLVHRFTSPHLVNWNERIEISSKVITDEYANQMAVECKEFADKSGLQVSYFEGMFAIAVHAFSKNPAVASILEVGMGGRLDATNAFSNSLVSVITYISLDHCKTLGETRELIAIEKAGIIKPNGILVIGKQEKEAMEVFLRIGKERNNRIFAFGIDWHIQKTRDGFVFEWENKRLELPMPALQGGHQIDNAGNAIMALMAQDKIKISNDSIGEGLKNTNWIGRLQDMSSTKLMRYLPSGAEFLLDGAHNDSGAKVLREWLKGKDKKYNILITSMLQRKNSHLFIENLNKCFDYVITIHMENEDKSKGAEEFKNEFLEYGWQDVVAINGNFIDGLKFIKQNFNNKNLRVVIAGSLYLVGEVLEAERRL